MGIALVTGASGGIGRALAREAKAHGHDVVLVARSEQRLVELASELGEGTQLVVADLSTLAGRQAVTSAVPRVDVLVNNAGYGDFGPFVDSDADRTMGMIDLNVAALTGLCRHYLPSMVAAGRGRVLNVASTAAFMPGPHMAVYYATKAYVLSFSEAIAHELKGTGVTVTALCPGPTASGFQAGASMEESKLVKGKELPTAEAVAAFGWKALEQGKVVAVHGLMNKVQALSPKFTPRRFIPAIVERAQRAH